MSIHVLTGQAVKIDLQVMHVLCPVGIMGVLGRFWRKGNRGDMDSCGGNSGRWKPETMHKCWDRTGVWWKNTERIREQEVLEGVSQEAIGKQDAFILQNVGVVISNLKTTLELFFSEIITMG